MAGEKIRTLSITDFRFGLNTYDMAHEIGENQSPDLQNVDLSRKGKTATRTGIAKLNTTVITSATGIFGAFYGKTAHLVAALTDVYKLNTSTWVYESIKGTLTSNAQTFFDEWENYVYAVNGADAPWKWTGSVVSALTAPNASWAAAPPNYICKHGRRLFALTASSSLLTWCAEDLPDQWLTTTYPDDAGEEPISPNNGYAGTGIVSQKSGLVIFKAQGIYKLTGKTPISYLVTELYSTIGCIAPRSIINIENRIIFLARYKGDYAVFALDDAGGLTHLSAAITTTLNTITTASANLASAVSYKDKYKLSFPVSGGWRTVNLFYKSGGWEFDSGNSMRCYYIASDTLYGGATGSGQVYTMDTGTADDATAITSYVKSKDYYMGAPTLVKTLHNIVIWVKASGNWAATLNLYIDSTLYRSSWSVQLGTKGGTETTRCLVIPMNVDVQGGMLAIKIGTSTINQPFELYRAELNYSISGDTAEK